MSQPDYVVFKNFISDQEANEIFNWTVENSDKPEFRIAGYPGTIRKVTRASKINFWPDVIYKVKQKVDNQVQTIFNLDSIEPYTCKRLGIGDGFYTAICTEKDACEMHFDPRWVKDHYTFHLNVMVSDHTGGHSILGNTVVELNKKDAIMFSASEVYHGTTELVGNVPRVFYCFGYNIPFSKIVLFANYCRAYSSIG